MSMKSGAAFEKCGTEFHDSHGKDHRCSLPADHTGKHWCAEHKVESSHKNYAFDSDEVDDLAGET